jgi:hypothetical protein
VSSTLEIFLAVCSGSILTNYPGKAGRAFPVRRSLLPSRGPFVGGNARYCALGAARPVVSSGGGAGVPVAGSGASVTAGGFAGGADDCAQPRRLSRTAPHDRSGRTAEGIMPLDFSCNNNIEMQTRVPVSERDTGFRARRYEPYLAPL